MTAQLAAAQGRLRVLEALAVAIGERGYEVDLADLAEAAGLQRAEVADVFPRKELAVLALYERLAGAFRETVELPEGPLAPRFRAAMEGKLAVLRPYRRGLSAIVRQALDPDDKLAVHGPASERIRLAVSAIFAGVVAGATDAPQDPAERRRLTHLLYALHLLVILVWMLDEEAVSDMLALSEQALGLVGLLPMWASLAQAGGRAPGLFERAERLAQRLLPVGGTEQVRDRASRILDHLLARHRLRPGVDPALARQGAREVWLDRVAAVLQSGQPLSLVLPGFPAKSPNPAKVLGALPDRAEQLALQSLEALCRELSELHPTRLVLASDGHVFGPVVGVTDAQCDAYRDAIRAMLAEMEARHLAWFDLADAFGPGSPEQHRQLLLERYGEPMEALRARGSTPLVDGIHRFLTEDELGMHPDLSKSQARTRTRERAWETVRRSQAWGALVASAFPEAVRLSIHPQPVASDKIGLHLLPVDDAWLTPWHGAALLDRDGYRLVKRSDFPEARVVQRDGRPDHLER